MAKRGSALAERIRRLQVVVVRQLNDHHIFLDQALPILKKARAEYEQSTHRADRKYYVPSRTKRGVAKRTDAELKAIYDAFINRDLLATTLIATVSLFEAFLFDVIRAVLTAYPKKLSISLQGTQGDPQVPLSAVIRADDLADVLEAVIARRIHAASYASPRDYLTYFETVTGVGTSDPVFAAYNEIKASRDILVHNSGVVNDIYLEKVGRLKRAAREKLLPIDQAYFDSCLAVLKRIANVIQAETLQLYRSEG
jgi:hypothetical protein